MKYGKKPWFAGIIGYASIRYPPVETRIYDTLRYVELSPDNASTFSYELGSALRDIGGIFGSLLDTFVKNTTQKTGECDISDYLKFLNSEVSGIERIGAELFCPFQKRMVFPFSKIKDEKIRPKERMNWWTPHNNLKHSGINNLPDGSLSNVVYGITSLAILCKLIYPRAFNSRLFTYAIGYFRPEETVVAYSFPSYGRTTIEKSE